MAYLREMIDIPEQVMGMSNATGLVIYAGGPGSGRHKEMDRVLQKHGFSPNKNYAQGWYTKKGTGREVQLTTNYKGNAEWRSYNSGGLTHGGNTASGLHQHLTNTRAPAQDNW